MWDKPFGCMCPTWDIWERGLDLISPRRGREAANCCARLGVPERRRTKGWR